MHCSCRFSRYYSSYYYQPESTRIPCVPKLESNNTLSDEQKLKMRKLCKEFKAPHKLQPKLLHQSLEHYMFKKQLKIVQAMKTKYNESILECEKELLVTTEPEFDSSFNYDGTGRFTNFNPNVIKRSV